MLPSSKEQIEELQKENEELRALLCSALSQVRNQPEQGGMTFKCPHTDQSWRIKETFNNLICAAVSLGIDLGCPVPEVKK